MIELSELIQELRVELQSSMRTSRGEPLVFELGPVQLELTVVVGREVGGKGGVRFWVVELGGEGKVSRESTQKVTLTLQPRVAATGQTAYVAGDEAAGER